MMQNNTILAHAYSSKYYDPVKAHEYYMKNRVLKGRQRRSLNEEGRLTEQYAKRQIDDDKKRKIAASLSNMKSKILPNFFNDFFASLTTPIRKSKNTSIIVFPPLCSSITTMNFSILSNFNIILFFVHYSIYFL